MILSGVTVIIIDASNEVAPITILGIFSLLFTYAYMREDSERALKNFELIAKKIVKQYQR